MKFKLITVIIISVLILIGGVLECIYIDSTMKQLIERIDDIMAKDPIVAEEVYQTDEWLDKKHKGLEFLIPHFELNELSVTYKEVIGAMERQDFDHAYILLNRIKEYAERLGDIYRFRGQNIV